MKKTLFFIFVANLFFAQNSELLNTNWQVTKVVGELFPDQYPPAMPYQQVTQFNNDFPQLNLSFFNMVSAYITYNGQDSFTLNNKTCTLADYMGDNGEVNQFFGRLCSFFDNGSYYHYTIQNNGAEKTLVVGNSIFQEIHFKSSILSTNETSKSKISVYPNPATEIVIIENLKPNSSLELIDNAGKLIRSISNIKTTKTEINIKNLASGIYYLKVEGEVIKKVIKN